MFFILSRPQCVKECLLWILKLDPNDSEKGEFVIFIIFPESKFPVKLYHTLTYKIAKNDFLIMLSLFVSQQTPRTITMRISLDYIFILMHTMSSICMWLIHWILYPKRLCLESHQIEICGVHDIWKLFFYKLLLWNLNCFRMQALVLSFYLDVVLTPSMEKWHSR